MTWPRHLSPAGRLLLLAALMGSTAIAASHASRGDAMPRGTSLRSLPLVIDDWRGLDRPAPSSEELAATGADDYLDRSYRRGDAAVGVYVGYYASQRRGDSVHSPMNCLPGTGWAPVETGDVSLAVRRGDGRVRTVTVRRLRVQRSADDAIVFYWYQSRGRVVASDYWSKAWLMYDAVRLNRTDTALVRAFSMVRPSDRGVARAEADLAAFVEALMPQLDRHLPS